MAFRRPDQTASPICCLFAHQELLNPIRRVDVRRDTRECWPRASSAACSRTEAETGEGFNNDGIAAKQPAWPDGNALGREVGRAISLSGCATDQYITRAVISVTGAVTMVELEALFERYDFNSFPVVEEGRILGIVTKFDFLRVFVFTTEQMVPHYDVLMRRQVADVMTKAVTHVGADDTIDPSSGIDGQPCDPQPAGVEPRARIGRHHLSGRCDARLA